jgi:hypothetical protein
MAGPAPLWLDELLMALRRCGVALPGALGVAARGE